MLVQLLLFCMVCLAYDCPEAEKFGPGPPSSCSEVRDPLNRPRSGLEDWFTQEQFYDLFPKANLGWGGESSCSPYSWESFIISARYFPKFATEYVTETPAGETWYPTYSETETYKRDLATFFSHSIQETGENDANLFRKYDAEKAKNCFYRGGLYNWFEGGPSDACYATHCETPEGGTSCGIGGRYWSTSYNDQYFYPVNNATNSEGNYEGCYFGRGTIQISYNFNYGPFNDFLQNEGIMHNGKLVDVLKEPNLIMTKRDPPLAFMASMWFYMNPQPPKPSMHDIIIGNWVSTPEDKTNGFYGPILGPTSRVINNECGGESTDEPGPGGENRRIKAFRFFCDYFGVPVGSSASLSCNGFSGFKAGHQSYDADWQTTWKPGPCNCTAQNYPGPIPYFSEDFPPTWREKNEAMKTKCEDALNDGWQSNVLGDQCQGQRQESKIPPRLPKTKLLKASFKKKTY